MTPRRSIHPVLLFSFIGHSLDHLFMLIFPTAVLAMEADFGMGFAELIPLMLASVVLFGLGAIPAGWLGDRWSARGTLIIMFFGLGISSIATGLAQSPLQLALGLGAIGLFASIYHPVATAVVVRYATRRGRDLGINGIFGGLGIAAGPFVAGLLSAAFGWRAAYIIPGVFGIIVGLAFIWFVREIAPAAKTKDEKSANGGNGGSVLPAFIAIVIAGVCVGFLYQAETIAIPKVFELRLTFLGGELSAVGMMAAAIFVFGAAAQYGGGLLSDRFSMKRLLALSLVIQIPVTFLAAQMWDIPLFVVAILMAVFTLGLQPVVDSLVALYVPPSWHARAYGVRFLAAIVVSSASVPVVAWIFDATGAFDWLFYGLMGIAAFGAITALTLPSEKRRVTTQ
ncbi:MAG: MFS transporter [Rhodospirillales bacterium]|nr:MFS transporter [Rhodospirillales bacterium]